MGKLLPEVDPGGLRRLRWHALRAGKFGDRGYSGKRHGGYFVLHHLSLLRVIRAHGCRHTVRKENPSLQSCRQPNTWRPERLPAIRIQLGCFVSAAAGEIGARGQWTETKKSATVVRLFSKRILARQER